MGLAVNFSSEFSLSLVSKQTLEALDVNMF